MKFETLILRSLFMACVLVCGLILAAMVISKPAPMRLAAAGNAIVDLLVSAPSSCVLPIVDNMICVRTAG